MRYYVQNCSASVFSSDKSTIFAAILELFPFKSFIRDLMTTRLAARKCCWPLMTATPTISNERQKPEVIRDQILSSKQIIEEQLQLPYDSFSYPNGVFTDCFDEYEKLAYQLGLSPRPSPPLTKAARGAATYCGLYT